MIKFMRLYMMGMLYKLKSKLANLVKPVLTQSAFFFRIDDYPSGIRPVVDDQADMFKLLDEIEIRQIPFHLGIVPVLMRDHFDPRILDYKYLIPVQHGFDHGYFKYSPLLIANGDLKNSHTFREQFNEFSGFSFSDILNRIASGRIYLENRFNCKVTDYIPPCNYLDSRTLLVLKKLGFRRCFTENLFFDKQIECISSDFYGRSDQLVESELHHVISFHVTWEVDLINEKGLSLFKEKLDVIKKIYEKIKRRNEKNNNNN